MSLGDKAIKEFWEEAYSLALASKNSTKNIKQVDAQVENPNIANTAISTNIPDNISPVIENTKIDSNSLGGGITLPALLADVSASAPQKAPTSATSNDKGIGFLQSLKNTSKGLLIASLLSGGLGTAGKVTAPILDSAANVATIAEKAKQMEQLYFNQEFNKLVYNLDFKTSLNKKLIDVYSDTSNYSYNPDAAALVSAARDYTKTHGRTLEENTKALENLYLLNREDKSQPIGMALNLIKQEEGSSVLPRRGFNVISTHAGLDEDGVNYATLGVESEVSRALGFTKGQRLYSLDFAQLVSRSPGYVKGLPIILDGCRLGLMNNKVESNFTQELATMLDTKVIASDGKTNFIPGLRGTIGSYEKAKFPVGIFPANVQEVYPSVY